MADDAARAAQAARETAESYGKAIEFLDSCDEFTYADFREADRIAGGYISEREARAMWDQASMMIPSPDNEVGPDFIRLTLRRTFEEAREAFGLVAERLGDKPKKGFRFWRK